MLLFEQKKKDVRWFSLPHDDNIILIIACNKVSAGVIKYSFFELYVCTCLLEYPLGIAKDTENANISIRHISNL